MELPSKAPLPHFTLIPHPSGAQRPLTLFRGNAGASPLTLFPAAQRRLTPHTVPRREATPHTHTHSVFWRKAPFTTASASSPSTVMWPSLRYGRTSDLP